MIEFDGDGIVVDVEGTTSSVRYVYDVLFPYARERLAPFLASSWNDPEVVAACTLVARDAGAHSLDEWIDNAEPEVAQRLVVTELERLMDGDIKATGLKQVQGLIWRTGYAAGDLTSHLYDDVPPALRAWHAAGIDLRIFSSGSIEAQKQFFGHTEFGNLLPLFRGHFDTTLGPKREPASYTAIAREMNLPPERILFLSDVLAELQGARAAGMRAVLVVRPGNAKVGEHNFRVVTSFAEIHVIRTAR